MLSILFFVGLAIHLGDIRRTDWMPVLILILLVTQVLIDCNTVLPVARDHADTGYQYENPNYHQRYSFLVNRPLCLDRLKLQGSGNRARIDTFEAGSTFIGANRLATVNRNKRWTDLCALATVGALGHVAPDLGEAQQR